MGGALQKAGGESRVQWVGRPGTRGLPKPTRCHAAWQRLCLATALQRPRVLPSCGCTRVMLGHTSCHLQLPSPAARSATLPPVSHRATCNEVMRVLRGNKDSVMAMLEAFVHDPLINWRLLNTGDNLPDAAAAATAAAAVHPQQQQAAAPDASGASTPSGHGIGAMGVGQGAELNGGSGDASSGGEPPSGMPADLRTGPPSPPRRDLTREQVLAAYGGIGDATEVLNERAVAVMKRMSDKLTGRDAVAEGMVAPAEPDSVAQQVQRLIALATSNEALCQSYIGESRKRVERREKVEVWWGGVSGQRMLQLNHRQKLHCSKLARPTTAVRCCRALATLTSLPSLPLPSLPGSRRLV